MLNLSVERFALVAHGKYMPDRGNLFLPNVSFCADQDFGGRPRLAKEMKPRMSAELRKMPAFFRASVHSGPGGIFRACSSATVASAAKSRASVFTANLYRDRRYLLSHFEVGPYSEYAQETLG